MIEDYSIIKTNVQNKNFKKADKKLRKYIKNKSYVMTEVFDDYSEITIFYISA